MNTRLKHIENWPKLAHQTKWSAATLAKACGVSVRTLERYFLSQTGKCPKSWLAEQRSYKAIELLRNGSTVKEIADDLGYKHASNFTRTFKKHWGCCPTAKAALISVKALAVVK